ncbi:restriction endonuclease (plasmid) [Streptomyces sp. FXJ1.172]|uniref:restriction endonuclease n=1 Tax=Streptomyces sp. FXJ1.172 TaxID=710705 RepID=UPI0023DD2918|nr:restriction endonuclease [Streptomyces sp. FXJ1.172]WEP00740.1 restriction endonuclease [Streptomyces sp. FXJ1.172]
MIIDRNASVVPPRFTDKRLRKAMGTCIARADHEDLLASFLWVHEGQIARDIHGFLERHRDRVQRERDHAEQRGEGEFSDPPLDEDYVNVAWDTEVQLDKELVLAQAACDESTKQQQTMREDYGDAAKIRERYTRGAEPTPSPLEDLIKIWDACIDASIRVNNILAEDRHRTHAIARDEARMLAYRTSSCSLTLKDIRAMHHAQFEHTVAELARRDGYTIKRAHGGAGDLGADVIAIAPDGRTRVVIQCKHTRRGATVGSPALQRLNGTARQVHFANVVVAITNGYYSGPAKKFARSQGITLLGPPHLEEWATWGVPLSKILEDLR